MVIGAVCKVVVINLFRYKAVASPLKYKTANTTLTAFWKVGVTWIIGCVAPFVFVGYSTIAPANQLRASITPLNFTPYWILVSFAQVFNFEIDLPTYLPNYLPNNLPNYSSIHLIYISMGAGVLHLFKIMIPIYNKRS